MDRSGNNVFFDPDDPSGYNLSATAKSYIAGLLKYAPEYTLVTNQYVNSYKRLSAGAGNGPRFATWGMRNRAAMIRVPIYKPGKQAAARIELRSPDPMANPYLVNTVTLAAGLDGIKRGLELPEEATSELLRLPESELRARGIEPLPSNLDEALDVFESSDFMKDALGEHIHSFFLKKKRAEWERFNSTVTEWELRHYLANS